MTFASVGTLGTGLSTANNQTTLAITTSAAAEAGNLVVVAVAVDNNQTTDGDSTAVASMADSASGNVWLRAKGQANGNGTNQTGADISIWWSVLKATIASGGTITATFTTQSTSDASAMSAWEFTRNTAKFVAVDKTGGKTDDATTIGALDVTTRSIECLRFRATASESSSTTVLTATDGTWTLISQAVSGAGTDTAEMGVRGEFKISTGTGDNSAPGGGPATHDHASAYAAFYEFDWVPPPCEPSVVPWQMPVTRLGY